MRTPDGGTLEALRSALQAVGEGDLNQRVPVPPAGAAGLEGLAEVVAAYNEMVAATRRRLEDEHTRHVDALRALRRLGEALAATHDRGAIMSAVLETSGLTLRARGAAFFEATPGGPLRPWSSWGELGPEGLSQPGSPAAQAAQSDQTVLLTSGSRPSVAVPVRLGNRLLGVVVAHGRVDDEPFSADDVDTLQTLVHQAETAIENAFLYDEATRLSITDGLTGLWNRRHFELQAISELQRAQRFGEPFGLLLADIDHFKSVNDTYGHALGDAVLVEVAGRITSATRDVDLVARHGGEEFALLLPRTDAEGTKALAERLREAVVGRPVEVTGAMLTVTVSVGAAVHPDHGATIGELVAAADGALYRAKAAGRDRVERADAQAGVTH